MGSKHHIRGGFSRPGAGIYIAAQQLCRLGGHQLAAIGRFAEHLIAGREVADDGGPVPRHLQRRGSRGPQILANFKAQCQTGDIFAAEHLSRAEDHKLLTQQGDAFRLRRCGSEPALFVKLAVIGQMGLGHHAKNLSFLYNDCAVIQFVVDPQGHAHRRYHLQVARCLQHGGKGLLRTFEQRFLIEEVSAGIARQSQLRQNQHLYPCLLCLSHQIKGFFRIIVAVGQSQLRRAAGDGDKTILHMNTSRWILL